MTENDKTLSDYEMITTPTSPKDQSHKDADGRDGGDADGTDGRDGDGRDGGDADGTDA